MKSSGLKKLTLTSQSVPNFGAVKVFVPWIAYDEELDCFYTDVESGSLQYQVKDLPENFHTDELLDIDPEDVSDLLAFQQSWGLVTTPSREPLRKNRLGVLSDCLSTPTKGGDKESDLQAAIQLFDELDARHSSAQEGALGMKNLLGTLMISTTVPHFYPFAPKGEVTATVRYLQDTVKKLTTAVTDGYDDWEGIESKKLEARVDDIDSWLTPYFPRIRVCSPEEKGNVAEAPTLPLSIATLSQLVAYLTSEVGYRECPYCHKLFVYKRRTSGEFVRNRRSVYCSDTCQQKAKYARKKQTNQSSGY